MTPATILVATLRFLPHGRALDRHLDACDWYALEQQFGAARLPTLRIAHVLGWSPLPPVPDVDSGDAMDDENRSW